MTIWLDQPKCLTCDPTSPDSVRRAVQELNRRGVQTNEKLNVDVPAIQSDITTIEGDITTIEGDITTIQGDISTIEGDISTINTNITNITNGTTPVPSIWVAYTGA